MADDELTWCLQYIAHPYLRCWRIVSHPLLMDRQTVLWRSVCHYGKSSAAGSFIDCGNSATYSVIIIRSCIHATGMLASLSQQITPARLIMALPVHFVNYISTPICAQRSLHSTLLFGHRLHWVMQKMEHFNSIFHIISHTVTLCSKKWTPFYFFNNYVRNKPIWITSGIRTPEEILRRYFWTCSNIPRNCVQWTIMHAYFHCYCF